MLSVLIAGCLAQQHGKGYGKEKYEERPYKYEYGVSVSAMLFSPLNHGSTIIFQSLKAVGYILMLVFAVDAGMKIKDILSL